MVRHSPLSSLLEIKLPPKNEKIVSEGKNAEILWCKVRQFWPKVEDDILQTI